jgi:predicted HAD superfamily Cof-like phosphohydrolase
LKTNFQDVGDFNDRFGLPVADTTAPCVPDSATMAYRIGFMVEEVAEFCEAVGQTEAADALKAVIVGLRSGRLKNDPPHQTNLPDALDALVDTSYVVLGTAHFMGLPFDEGWNEVHLANMMKIRVQRPSQSGRNSPYDVIKPPTWTPPNHEWIIAASAKRFSR